jgi:hypothetical protein
LAKLDKEQEEFYSRSEFAIQEQTLVKKRREKELENELTLLENDRQRLTRQLEDEKAQWAERIQQQEEGNVTLRAQIQVKESDRRNQELKLEEDLKIAREEWNSKIQFLDVKLEEERQKWLSELSMKEAEFRSVRMEQEKKEASLKMALRTREEEIGALEARAQGQVEELSKELEREKTRYTGHLKTREEECEKLKVELMLLESQFKVDAEKTEAELLALQKDAQGKIQFLEKRIQEEKLSGQKALEAKQSEIQSIEMQFSLRRKGLEEEFNQRKPSDNDMI